MICAIKGIGPKRLEKMRKYLTVGKPQAKAPRKIRAQAPSRRRNPNLLWPADRTLRSFGHLHGRSQDDKFTVVCSKHLMGWLLFDDVKRDLVGDGDAVAFEGDNFFGMVGQDANVFEAEVDQNLRADAAFVLDHALTSGLAVELAARMNMNLRELAGLVRLIDAETAASVMEIE